VGFTRPCDPNCLDNHHLGHATLAAPDRPDSIIRRLEEHDQGPVLPMDGTMMALVHAMLAATDGSISFIRTLQVHDRALMAIVVQCTL